MTDPMTDAQRRLLELDIKSVGKRLQWAREIREPNRSEFARELRVNVATIRHIESGTRVASLPMLRLIVHTLRIPWAYVLDGNIRPEDYDVVLLGEIVQRHPELAQPATPDRPRSRKPRNPGNPQPASVPRSPTR